MAVPPVRAGALLLIALLAFPALADARPRKKPPRKLRGQVSAMTVALPGALSVFTPPATPGAGPGTPVPGPDTPPPAPLPTGSGRALMVTTDDRDPEHLKLLLSRQGVLAGEVKLTLDNANGEDPHNLVLDKPPASILAFEEVAAESVATTKVTLTPGTWKAYCALDGHEAKGMVARFTVG